VLLDSGNLVGNCVDERWLMSAVHANHLRTESAPPPFPTRPCDQKIRLADGKTTLHVKQMYQLTLSLTFADQQFSLTAWFYPIPLSQSFILGYRALTTVCYPLFMKVVNHHHELWIRRCLAQGICPLY